jgi:hypothetical protein
VIQLLIPSNVSGLDPAPVAAHTVKSTSLSSPNVAALPEVRDVTDPEPDTTIETRLPKEDWIKTVTLVPARAKTGHDWEGEFMNSGQLADMNPGALIVGCTNVGTGSQPRKCVSLYLLRPSGKWSEMIRVTSQEWAYKLRDKARLFLALSSKDRALAAIEEALSDLRHEREAIEKKMRQRPAGSEDASLTASIASLDKRQAGLEAQKQGLQSAADFPQLTTPNPLSLFRACQKRSCIKSLLVDLTSRQSRRFGSSTRYDRFGVHSRCATCATEVASQRCAQLPSALAGPQTPSDRQAWKQSPSEDLPWDAMP